MFGNGNKPKCDRTWVFSYLFHECNEFDLRHESGKRYKDFAIAQNSIRFQRPCRTTQRYALAASCGFALRPGAAHQNFDSKPPGTAQRRALFLGSLKGPLGRVNTVFLWANTLTCCRDMAVFQLVLKIGCRFGLVSPGLAHQKRPFKEHTHHYD
jgi:hypothetical protein